MRVFRTALTAALASGLLGFIASAGPVAATGPDWSALGDEGGDGPIHDPAPGIYAVAVHDGKVYAGGFFTDADGDPTADYLAVWDPGTSSWSGLGGNGDGALD